LRGRKDWSQRLASIGLLAVALSPACVRADNLDTSMFSLRGFGTLGAVHSNQDQADFVGNIFQPIAPNYRFFTLAATYDPGDWLLMAEWVRFDIQSSVYKIKNAAWYLTGGYPIAAFTPYVTLAQAKINNTRLDDIPTAGLPPPLAQAAAALNGVLEAITNRFTYGQNSASAGVRWDFRKHFDLKVQYDHLRTAAGSSGHLTNLQPGFQPGDNADVFSVAVDFVF
jgi:hypothetical protein